MTSNLAANRHLRPTMWLVVVLALLAMAPAARLLAIDLRISYDETDRPTFDPDGARLKIIFAAAETYYESILLSPVVFEFEFWWENLDDSIGRLGETTTFLGTDIVIDTTYLGVARPWFFDPTPLDHTEFDFNLADSQTLYGDINPQLQASWFNGQVPGQLEVDYQALARPGTQADGQQDLFSVVIHEIGHALGMIEEVIDDKNEYEFRAAHVGGVTNAAAAEHSGLSNSDGHLAAQSAMMNPTTAGLGIRRLPSQADLLAFDGIINPPPQPFPNPPLALVRPNLPRVNFIGAESTEWDGTLNWIGGRVPDGDNEVYVRNGGDVWLNGSHSTAAELVIDRGSSLLMRNNNLLQVFGRVQVGAAGGERSELYVGNLAGPARLEAESLRLTNGLLDLLSSDNGVGVSGDLLINTGGTLRGAGAVEVAGLLSNDGEIVGGTVVIFTTGGELTLRTTGAGMLDLDGPTTNGQISATIGNLRVEGPLSDAFSGVATIGAGRTMTFTRPWVMDGRLVLHGGADASSLATLTGSTVTVGGQVEADGHARISASVVLAADTVWNIPGTLSVSGISEPGGAHTFTKTGVGTLVANMFIDGAKNISQGVFQGSMGGAGPITVAGGGTWNVPSGFSSSPLNLNGLPGSVFASTLVKEGAGTTTLIGPVTIQDNPNISAEAGGQLFLPGGVTSVNNSGFGVHGLGEVILSGPGSGAIRANVFGGQLTIAHSNALGTGSVNVQDISGATNIPAIAFTEGVAFANPMTQGRATIVALGNVTISSEITPRGLVNVDNTINVPQASHTLHLTGNITADTVFGSIHTLTKTGNGAAVLSGDNVIPGGLTVARGMLANHGTIAGPTTVVSNALLIGSGQFADLNVQFTGRLAPGSSADPDVFSPARMRMEDLVFSNLGRAGTTLLLEIGGERPGSEYDQLMISGNATLAGNLSVSLASGYSLRQGEEFIVLDIAGTRSGQFRDLGEGGLVGNFDGRNLHITYFAGDGNDVALFAAAPPITADFNGDGDVDGDDLALWESNFGPGDVDADADDDGDSDGADFLAWQRQVGNDVPAAAASAVVPEPSGAVITAAAAALLAANRPRRPQFLCN